MLERVISPGFLVSYWSAGFGTGTFLQVSALATYWLEVCAYSLPTPEKNDQYNTEPTAVLLVQYRQQAIPLLSMHNRFQ
jgi:hypothetical protein